KLPGSYYTGRGNEAASVGVATAMGEGDVASPLHRNLGVHVVRGVRPAQVFGQFMGRAGGATRGRDSNLRSNDFDPGRGLLAGVSHLPAMIPTITGIALAFQLRQEPRVAIGWCGDGAAARGAVHDAAGYVPRELLAEFAAKDPLDRFRGWLEEVEQVGESELAAIATETAAWIDAGVAEAEACPQPDPAALLDGVYA